MRRASPKDKERKSDLSRMGTKVPGQFLVNRSNIRLSLRHKTLQRGE